MSGAPPSGASAPAPIPTPAAASSVAPMTRAPWASASVGAGGGGAMTRAPWAQGVSVGAAAAGAPVQFDSLAQLHPEYVASLAAMDDEQPTATAAALPASSSGVAAAAQPAASAGAAAAAAAPRRYGPPCKIIKTPSYMPLWRETCAYAELTSFIMLLNDRVRGVRAQTGPSRSYAASPQVACIVQWLEESKAAIANIPPIQQSMRFGNKAFRIWLEQRTSRDALLPLLTQLLSAEQIAAGAADELIPYLQDSFGSHQRIDYGTGHELNFVLWLCALNKLGGVFGPADYAPLVLEAFRAYILLMEELQSVYWLEPAGSKGAWGLDDYQFLVFLWGTSQLMGSEIAPGDFLRDALLQSPVADEYLFLIAIKFVRRMKSGPFHEHSSFLHHISTLPSWSKANSGLVAMYRAEVLDKFPIVQHILFGRIMQFKKFDKTRHTLAVHNALDKHDAATVATKPSSDGHTTGPASAP